MTKDGADLSGLVRDPALARLEAVGVPFDPLTVLRWGHREAPHTRFLAWLLDPSPADLGAQHGLGAAMLQALVRRAIASFEALPGTDAPDGAEGVTVREATVQVIREAPVGDGVHATARAPDVRCAFEDATGQPWVVMIENKVDAAEGTGQVRAYQAWARGRHPEARRMLVYITADGRMPDSGLGGELTAALSWTAVAEVGIAALDPHNDDTHGEARGFARMVLEALRHRFGGAPEVRALVQGLHDRHPRAAARVASWATEPARVTAVTERFPAAAWHLRMVRPGARSFSRRWAEAVARAFGEIPGQTLRLTVCAPHAECRDAASWAIEGVTETLSLALHATGGRAFGSPAAKLWAGLYAPGKSAAEAFDAREQRAAVEALPAATRAWLEGARPVATRGDAWRTLCAGEALTLPRGFSAGEDPARVADLANAMLAPHATALMELARDRSLRLYSCDLDGWHTPDPDARDREALAESAGRDAVRVLIVGRHRDDHMIDLCRERALGLALGASFGGHGTLRYDYTHAALGRADVAVLGTRALRGPDDASFARLRGELGRAMADGARVLVLGEDGPTRLCAGALMIDGIDLLAPIQRAHPPELRAGGECALSVDGAWPALSALVSRDARLVTAVLPVSVTGEAETLATCTLTRGEAAGHACAWIARWRARGTRVTYWGGGAMGPWGSALRERPEAFGRWWQQLASVA